MNENLQNQDTKPADTGNTADFNTEMSEEQKTLLTELLLSDD